MGNARCNVGATISLRGLYLETKHKTKNLWKSTNGQTKHQKLSLKLFFQVIRREYYRKIRILAVKGNLFLTNWYTANLFTIKTNFFFNLFH